MANFWRLTGALVLVCAVALGGVQLIGRRQPIPIATLFTNPDGTPCQRPCLFGVRPGETSYQDAIKLLQMHPFTSRFEPYIDLGVFSGPGLSVIVFLNDYEMVTQQTVQLNPQRVSRIDLVRTSDLAPSTWASLGEVVATLGAPDFVDVDDDSTRSYYLATSMMFFHSQHTAGSVSPDERFDCMFVFADPHKIKLQLERSSTTWRGFSSVKHYPDVMSKSYLSANS